MTSEIAIMNRRAVALAADGATTVQYWENGEKKLRYFKGANKIFNLSCLHPVAVMTYESGNLHGIPWEVLVKAYREHLASGSRDFLAGYSSDFLEYIQKNRDLYVHETQVKQLIKGVTEQAGFLVQLMAPLQATAGEKDIKKKTETMEEGFQKISNEVTSHRFIGTASKSDVDDILHRNRPEITAALRSDPFIADRASVLDVDQLAELSVRALFSAVFSTMEKAGLVICGFGQKDYFPVLEQYNFYGILMGKLIYERADCRQISQENVTEILPFARSEMSKSFIYGAQPLVMEEIDRKVTKAFDNFEGLLRRHDPTAEADLTDLKARVKKQFFLDLTAELNRAHTSPMKRVVGSLPVDELAELAEILIRMESLKERFYQDSDSAGGPIDVAVLTKGDGFIWIKHKHYVDPHLNPRYLGRNGTSPHA